MGLAPPNEHLPPSLAHSSSGPPARVRPEQGEGGWRVNDAQCQLVTAGLQHAGDLVSALKNESF